MLRLATAALCAGALCVGTNAQDEGFSADGEIEVVGEEDDSAESFHRCSDPEETGSGIVDSFPRFAADMQRVPSGPEEYTWFRWDETCTTGSAVCIAETSEGTGRCKYTKSPPLAPANSRPFSERLLVSQTDLTALSGDRPARPAATTLTSTALSVLIFNMYRQIPLDFRCLLVVFTSNKNMLKIVGKETARTLPVDSAVSAQAIILG